MREIDKREAVAMGRTPKDALRIGLRTSMEAVTVLKDGKPIAMMGVAPKNLLAGSGIIWFLGTDQVYREGRALLTLGPRVIGAWLNDFRVLENLVSTENTRAIRLLRRWGAEVRSDPQIYGGVEFVEFVLSRDAIFGPP